MLDTQSVIRLTPTPLKPHFTHFIYFIDFFSLDYKSETLVVMLGNYIYAWDMLDYGNPSFFIIMDVSEREQCTLG